MHQFQMSLAPVHRRKTKRFAPLYHPMGVSRFALGVPFRAPPAKPTSKDASGQALAISSCRATEPSRNLLWTVLSWRFGKLLSGRCIFSGRVQFDPEDS